MESCKYCNKECKNLNSETQHEIRCKYNPDKLAVKPKSEKWLNSIKNRKIKNQFDKARELGISVPEVSEETRNKISNSSKGRSLTQEHRNKISASMKQAVLNNPDSYSASNVSGRVKTYEYNGKKLKGKWELLVAESLDEANIQWDNNIQPIPYLWNDNEHLYFPDFYIEQYDLYIEVKGYQRDRDLAKWKVLDNLLILKKNEIKLLRESKLSIHDLISNHIKCK